jgi:bis(5'-nucleosyl)-tetraphosphatase (symmetrical)
MRTIFIGDIHGCAAEFQRMIETVDFRRNTDRLFLTGDAFTKGPAPDQVWELIRATDARMVLGNHDVKVIEWFHDHDAGQTLNARNPDALFTMSRLIPLSKDVLPWLESLPLWIEEPDFLLVHAGVNPEKGWKDTTRDEFLAIRTWPPTGGLEGPRWHDVYPPENKLIIFGHDAPGGLVVKRREDGSPYAVGLDSGCVYGRLLSAYILEEDRIIQV